MSYQQQIYGLTSERTPKQSTLKVLSPKIVTPRGDAEEEICTGWTPYFAEEYSVFNSTPGRLTNCVTFTLNSPLQQQSNSYREATSELDRRVNPTVESQPLLGSDTQIQRLSTLASNVITRRTFDTGSVTQCVTPKPVKKIANEIFTGQTATPPASASQTPRKFDQIHSKDNVHRQIQNLYTSPTAMRQSTKSRFSSDPILSYENSCIKKNVSSFSTDFHSPNDDIFFPSSHHNINNHYNWSDATNSGLDHEIPILYSEVFQSQNLNKQSAYTDSFSGGFSPNRYIKNEDPRDHFLNASISGVNPGLLMSRKSSLSMSSTSIDASSSLASPKNSTIKYLIPYEHQWRESIRCEEESHYLQSFSHRRKSLRKNAKKESPPPIFLANVRPSKKARKNEELSFKNTNLPQMEYSVYTPLQSLGSPEMISELPRAYARTELRLIVDSNGRARTEMIVSKQNKRESTDYPENSYPTDIMREKNQLNKGFSSRPTLNRCMELSQHIFSLGDSQVKGLQDHQICSLEYDHLNDDLRSNDTNTIEAEPNTLNYKARGDAKLELWEVIKSRKRKEFSEEPQESESFSRS
ncbi:putative phd-finger domain-containing protein [Erysiphe necator]|uniref:Putative phd-finger domain-containing protein n=1 Tax=Uncinula necator TaxID=52586 RepID=A0A0B1PAG2_UNCNE|nr:putative phd-finger domain-containing protein [Erysiphe necator]